MIGFVLISVAVTATSFVGVALYRRWSLRRNVVDVPNERSSHSVPTPRGGGIVIVFLVLSVYAAYVPLSGGELNFRFIGGALLVAAVSFVDDFRHVPAPIRLFVQAIAAGLVWQGGGFEIGAGSLGQAAGMVVTVGWIVWMTNAYNFMDGIDGIAGVQAVTAGICWAILGYFGESAALTVLGLAISSASLGFLVHNWSPAKIFMGDVGAAVLGFVFAAMPFVDASALPKAPSENALKWAAVLAVWLFVFDSVLTLVRRIISLEPVWQAHRRHIYQRLVQTGMTHAAVTTLYAILSATVAAAVVTEYIIRGTIGLYSFLVAGVLAAGLAVLWQQRERR